jgi:hypothetical protein
MSERGVTLLLEGWRRWALKVLDCGVANVGNHTGAEIRAWADLAGTAGWHEDAELALSIVDEQRPLAERSRRFITSTCRLGMATGLWLREDLMRRDPEPTMD